MFSLFNVVERAHASQVVGLAWDHASDVITSCDIRGRVLQRPGETFVTLDAAEAGEAAAPTGYVSFCAAEEAPAAAAVTMAGEAVVLAIPEGSPLRRLEIPEGLTVSFALAIDPLGNFVAVGTACGRVLLYDVRSMAPPKVFDTASGAGVTCLSLGKAEYVLAGCDDGSVTVFCMRKGRQTLYSVPVSAQPIRCVAYSAVEDIWAAGDELGRLNVYLFRNGSRISSDASSTVPLTGIAFDKNGSWIATSAMDGLIRIYDRSGYTLTHWFENEGKPMWALAFNQTGSRLLAAGASGDIIVYTIGKKH